MAPAAKRAPDEATGQPAAKKVATAPVASGASSSAGGSAAPPAAGSAAPPAAAPGAPPGKLSITQLLESENASTTQGALRCWVRGVKTYVDAELLRFLHSRKREVPFTVPAKCSLIPPLAVTDAASGANLTSFREAMDYDHLIASFSRTKEYEAAGTVWMLDPTSSEIEDVSVSQLEGAMGLWTDDTFRSSSKNPQLRRFTFDVPLPALVVDAQVAQPLEPGKPAVCVTEPLVMIAGRSVVITWYAAMCDALRESNNEERVWHLFNAALSVPIRMRVQTDADATTLAALTYGEKMFAASAASGADNFWRFAEKVCALNKVASILEKNESGAKLEAQLKEYGVQFKGKPIVSATATALKGLRTFVVDGACAAAYALAEPYFPELREPTLLMRIGFACSNRAVSDAKARELFGFLMHSFRALRLTGEIPKDEKLTVSRAVGRDKKTPGLVHALFKKRDLVEYIFHEASLLNQGMERDVDAFKTPRDIVKRFAASGADGLVASHRASDSGGGADGMETMFAIPVADYRNAVDPKAKALIDVAWALWSGTFDDEFTELTQQEMQPNAPVFAWHSYLMETSESLGAKYRAYIAACYGGPIPANPAADDNLGLLGVSEYGAEELEELGKLRDLLKQLRRTKVKFVSLPSVGGASGAEYTAAQLQHMWDGLSLGHRFGRKKTDVRAFVLSADLFPPNLVKQGTRARLTEQVACDEAKLKRVIEFFAQKRHRDDIIIFLDGRSRENRRVIESCEKKMSSSDTHAYVETWHVYLQPTKKEDPRAPQRPHMYSKNNRETAIFSLPAKGAARKVMHRAEANACGETSTADTSYTGTAMRRLSELPRMSYDTKASILGTAACGSVAGANTHSKLRALQGDVDSKGHPFSYNEVKPISLWQSIMEQNKVTHIVDLTPGSGALAVAASGAIEYEGVATNDAHRDWLDSIVDRIVMYKAGHETGFAEQLGGDAEFVEKASKYFGKTMPEAKRLLMPLAAGEDGEEEEEDVEDDEEEEEW